MFDGLSITVLKTEVDLKKLIVYLDKILGKDDLADSFLRYEEFEDCKREASQSMNDSILQFDEKYNKLVKININIPSEIVAFKMIKDFLLFSLRMKKLY